MKNTNEVLKLLERNGIDQNYLEEMEGIEFGSSEWMDVLSELVGKNMYNDTLSQDDDNKIQELITTLKYMGIYFV